MNNFYSNMMKKSLKERFLLVIGVLFFIIYLTMGLAILFWQKLPLPLSQGYRTTLGIAIIVYAFLRFIRFFQKS
ncbi:hypothetical protein EQG63_05390 [Flavobacterium amnicola]|jgi:hypothetical protein|uniref:Uncharacterized protein n=2 Tax=Flavobacterium amnicola TaxID=2506422 RepID=A0A4Q1K613_9FLAO|nr:hypothetical protein [Flavobacterium sp.]RXR21376.1 hypothetical protein EQG63_05390 [Flavobacterium amnicola]